MNSVHSTPYKIAGYLENTCTAHRASLEPIIWHILFIRILYRITLGNMHVSLHPWVQGNSGAKVNNIGASIIAFIVYLSTYSYL